MKRTKLKRKSKSPIVKIQDEIWQECRRITLAKYGDTCFTCGKQNLEGSNRQLGHFIPKASCGAFLKYDLRNLRIQCMHCNINLGGNGAEYYRRMVAEIGQEEVDKIFQDKNITVKAIDFYIMHLDTLRNTL